MTEGLEPSSDAETFTEFDRRIARTGVVPAIYRDLSKQVGDLGPKDTTAESAREKMSLQKASSMRAGSQPTRSARISSFAAVKEQLPPASTAMEPHNPAVSRAQPGRPVYDLRGVACPLNYVKTKLKLEMMDAGENWKYGWMPANRSRMCR